jgi:uncharacterized protein YjbI with pentapeptide repeats
VKIHLAWIAIATLFMGCKKSQDAQPKARFTSVEEAQAHLLRTKECQGCDLSKAELSSADLAGANLKDAVLQGCDLTRANLAGATFEGAKMKRCDLSTAANLNGANFKRADLTLANLTGSDTQSANFCEATLPDGSKAPPCAVADHITK